MYKRQLITALVLGDVNTAKPKPRIAKSIAKIYNGKDSLINKPISRSDAEMIAIPLERCV